MPTLIIDAYPGEVDSVKIRNAATGALLATISGGSITDANSEGHFVIVAGTLTGNLWHVIGFNSGGDVSWQGYRSPDDLDGSGALTGQYQLSVTITDDDDDGVSGVIVSIAGTTKRATTNAIGVAFVYLDPGDYTIRYSMPYGYQQISERATAIASADVAVEETASAVSLSSSDVVGLCDVHGRVVDASGDPVVGATVVATASESAVLVESPNIMSQVVSKEITDSDGVFVLRLVRSDYFSSGSSYTVRIRKQSDNIFRTVTGSVPAAASCTIDDLV